MTNETVCIFPDTRPKDEKLFPLVQFFRQAVHIQPAENDIPAKEDLPPLAQELLELGQLRFECPAPLLGDGERFLSLVGELRRPGDHAGRLASLFLSGLGRSDEEEAGPAIVGAVRRQTGGTALAPSATDERTHLLWQARLVLKLGELLDQQQQEVQQGLLRAASRESALLERLREPDDVPLAVAALPQPGTTDSRLRLRLKAWRHLVALGSKPLTAHAFVAADRDAFELLLEECSPSRAVETRSALILPLPARWTGGTLAERLNLFRLAAVGLIPELLCNPAASAEAKEQWERLLEQHYPAAEHGRCRLCLHFFAADPHELLLDRTGLNPLQPGRGDGAGTTMGFME